MRAVCVPDHEGNLEKRYTMLTSQKIHSAHIDCHRRKHETINVYCFETIGDAEAPISLISLMSLMSPIMYQIAQNFSETKGYMP